MSSTRQSAGIDSQSTRREGPLPDGADAPGTHRRRRVDHGERLADSRAARERDGVTMEEREVAAHDPAFSSETNAMLTDELREVVGADHVRVPVDRSHTTDGEFPDRRASGMALLASNRLQTFGSLAVVAVFGAIIALTSGDWWLLPVAVGIHGIGTMFVTLTIVRLTTSVEHPSAELAAALSEEGVHDTDERFTHMVEEFSAVPRAGTSEALSPVGESRVTPAIDDGATAAGEQSGAVTPTAEPSQAHDGGGAPDAIIFATTASLAILSIILPITSGGGWLWLLPAAMLPLLGGLVAIERLFAVHQGEILLRGRRTLVGVAAAVALSVVVLCAVVAIAYTS